MAVCYAGISLQNQRKVNMDSLLLKKRTLAGRELCLAVVCDGVGSLEQGMFAASLATRMLSEWFEKLEDTSRLGLRLRDYVMEIHRTVAKRAQAYQIETASTFSALLLDQTRYYVVHVGDSRIYCFRGSVLTQLTQDQTAFGKLTSCLGYREQPTIFYNEGVLQGELFLLCTDGLYKRLDTAFFQQELAVIEKKQLRKAVERLAQCAIERGERDNISLALVWNEREGHR